MSDQIQQKLYKIDPKLRMIVNGDEIVNTLRAEQAPAVTVQEDIIKKLDLPLMRDLAAQSSVLNEIEHTERTHLEKVSEDVYVDVYIKVSDDFVKLSKQELKKRRIRRPIQKYNMISAEVPLSELQDLIEDPKVISVEIPEQIRFSPPINLSVATHPPEGGIRRNENAPEHHERF